ncbi:MAG: hypothetical protein P8165_08900 [Deltaproteobacteria bacterium]
MKHKDVEYGFVVETEGKHSHWCHFWSKRKAEILRTKNRPEVVPNYNLMEKKSVSQKQVGDMMAKLKIPR